MADYRRARWGLRRTFQTEMAIEKLSVYDNVAMIHEHSRCQAGVAEGRRARRDRVRRSRRSPKAKVGELGARERRLVEVARAVVGKPERCAARRACGRTSDEQTSSLGEVIRRIPDRFGALVILVDHDMSLVSACCETTAVLDFGKLIASGRQRDVLRDENVMRAYLGTEEVGCERGGAMVQRSRPFAWKGSRARGRPPRRPRGLTGDPAGAGDDPPRRQRRGQVDPRARGRRHPAPTAGEIMLGEPRPDTAPT